MQLQSTLYFIILLIITSCSSRIEYESALDNLLNQDQNNNSEILLISIEQQSTQDDPTSSAEIFFDISFSSDIEVSSFTADDISQMGSADDIVWSISKVSGSSKDFILKASGAITDGSVIPYVSPGLVSNRSGRRNAESASYDNVVIFDQFVPSVTIERKSEGLMATLPIEFDVVFSEEINDSTFTLSDIINTGTSTVTNWQIINSGDNQNYVIRAVTGSVGTIIPSLNALTVNDLAGNPNNASTSNDNSVIYDSVQLGVTLEQSVGEVIGSCTFSAQADPTISQSIEFKVTFTAPIDSSTFTPTDITQNGNAVVDSWNIDTCGDDIHFKITSNTISEVGTVEPSLLQDAVTKSLGSGNTASSSMDNSVSYSTTFYTWTGLGIDDNWTTVENWLNDSVPTTSDSVLFTGKYCTSCDAIMNSNVSIGLMRLEADYNGTITQAPGSTFRFGEGYKQFSGTFLGGDSTITAAYVTGVSRRFELMGGSFTSTSGVFSVNLSRTLIINPAATFLHNNGTINFTGNGEVYLTPGDESFYNFSINKSGGYTPVFLQEKLIVDNDLYYNNTGSNGVIAGASLSKEIELKGDLSSFGSGLRNTNVTLTGNSDQLIYAEADVGGLEIASTGGTVTLQGAPRFEVAGNRFKYTSGAYAVHPGTVDFRIRSSNGDIDFPNFPFSDLFLSTSNMNNVGTIKTSGNLTIESNDSSFYGGVFEVGGDLSLSDTRLDSRIILNGASDQNIAFGGPYLPRGKFEVDKPAGQVIQQTSILLNQGNSSQDLEIINGAWNMNGNDLTVHDQLNVGDGIGAAGSAVLLSNCGIVSSGTQTIDPTDGVVTASSSNPNVTIDDVLITEGEDAIFTVSLSEPVCGSDFTVDLRTNEQVARNLFPSDFTAMSSTLTLSSGENSGTITITTIDDPDFEKDETFSLELSNASHGTITDSSGVATIQDNDLPTHTWTGLGVDDNWSTAANWSTGTVPIISSVVVFDSTCTNCNSLIDGDFTFRAIFINDDYSGNLDFGSGNTIEVGTGFYQGGGSVDYGNSELAWGRNFTYTGGTYDLATSTISVYTNVVSLGNFGVMLHDFYNFSIRQNTTGTFSSDGTITVNNDLYVANSGGGGTFIDVHGDVVVNTNSNSFNLKLVGSADQNVTMTNAELSSFEVASTGGIVTVSGDLTVSRDFKYTSGLVEASLFNIHFFGNNAATVHGTSNMKLGNVSYNKGSGYLQLTDDLYITGNLDAIGSGVQQNTNEKIFLDGNYNIQNTPTNNTAPIVFTGVNDQLFSSAITNLSTGGYIINKSAGSVILQNEISLLRASSDINVNDGIFNLSGNDLTLAGQLYVGDGVGLSSSATVSTNCATISASSQNINPTDGAIIGTGENPNITISDASTTEGGDLTFIVSYSEAICSGASTVDYSFKDINTNDLDFSSRSEGTVSFAIGETSKEIVISSADDSFIELVETFNVRLENNSHGSITDEICVGTINDNEAQTSYVWTGLGVGDNWNTAGNWSGGIVPGPGDTVLFDGTCTNCNALINVSVGLRSFLIDSSFSGTITQANGVNLNVGGRYSETRGWQQLGGVFIGGDSDNRLLGDFHVLGGSYTATSAQTEIFYENNAGSISIKDSSLIHNNGTLRFSRHTWASSYNSAFSFNLLDGVAHFHNLIFDIRDAHNSRGYNSLYLRFSESDIVHVAGNLTFENGEVNEADFQLSGDLKIDCPNKSSQYRCAGGGSSKVHFIGNNSQEYEVVDDGRGPILVVNTTGTVSPKSGTTQLQIGGLELIAGTFNAPATMSINTSMNVVHNNSNISITGGTFNHNSGTVILDSESTTSGALIAYDLDSSTQSWDLFNFHVDVKDSFDTNQNDHSIELVSGSIINVAGDFTFDNGILNGGEIRVGGNIVSNCEQVTNFVDCPGGGTTDVVLNGTVDQNLSIAKDSEFLNIEANKPSGDVLQTSDVFMGTGSQALTLTNGTWNAAGYNLDIPGALTLESGTTLESGCGRVSYGSLTNNGGTLNVLDSEPMTLTNAQTTEGEPLVFEAVIDRTCPRDIRLEYSLISNQNISNDVSTVSGVVTLNRGDTKSTIIINTVDDTDVEGNENITLSANATNLNGGFSLLANGEIIDNDSTGIQIKKAAIGGNFMCLLYTDGNVKCLGDRESGVLADGTGGDIGIYASDMGDNLSAVNLGTGKYATQVSNGSAHTCAVLNDGYLKCWGGEFASYVGHGLLDGKIGRYVGQMGDNLPYAKVGSLKVKKVASGGVYNCAIFENDQMKCFGKGGAPFGYADNSINYGSGPYIGDSIPYVDVGSGLSVKDVSLGSNSMCVILSNDKLKCWGLGSYGRLGNESEDSIGGSISEVGDGVPIVDLGSNYLVKQVAIGNQFGCALLDDDLNGINNVKCWGRGGYGKLGLGDDNSTQGDDVGEMGDGLSIVNLGAGRTAKSIGVGNTFACAYLDNDTVKCWGEGSYIGQESTTSTDSTAKMLALDPVDFGAGRTVKELAVYDRHACVILDDDTLKCWGYAGSGRLGSGFKDYIGDEATEMGDSLPIVNLGTGRTAKKISQQSSRANSTCVILDNNELKCFGEALHGALGLEHMSIGDDVSELSNLANVDLGTGRRAIDIASTARNTCAVLDNGDVRCWGATYQQSLPFTVAGHDPDNIGDGIPIINLGGKKAKRIKAGEHAYCVVLEDDSLSCWGRDNYGKIGNNGISTSVPQAINIGSNKKILDFDIGSEATCLVYTDGTSACWGRGEFGSLANGNTGVVQDPTTQLGDNLYFNDHGSKTPISVHMGVQTCFQYSDMTSRCYGPSPQGIGQGSAGIFGEEQSDLGDNLPVIDWGNNLVLSSLSAGGSQLSRTCAIFVDGKVKCHGRSLGLGTGANLVNSSYGTSYNKIGDDLPMVTLDKNEKAKDIFHGDTSICILTNSDKLRCYGFNHGYFFGIGLSENEVGDDADEIGQLGLDSSLPTITSSLGSFNISGITGGSDSIHDSFLNNLEATVNWSASAGVSQYRVAIFEDDRTSIACSEQTTASTSYAFTGCTLTAGNTYYVSLTAEDGGALNTLKANNSFYPFTVDTSSPANFNILGVIGDLDTSVDATLSDGVIPILKWQSATGATNYNVTVYTTAAMTVEKCTTKNISASLTEYNFSDCSNSFTSSDQGSTFYANIEAIDRFGNSTLASNGPFAFSITDSQAPESFSITGITGSGDSTIDNTLSAGSWARVHWQDTRGENSYDVTIYSDQVGTVECSTVNVARDTTSTSFDSCELSGGSTYYAEVIAKDTFNSIDSDEGNLFEFSVSANSLSSFNILGIEGVGGDTTADNQLTFGNLVDASWGSSTGATNYTVKILDVNQDNNLCTTKTTSGTSLIFNKCYLKSGKDYFLSVVADNGTDFLEAQNGPLRFSIINYPSITLDSPSVSEGTNLVFTATLSNTWTQDITANWKIVSLDAISGVDYVRSEGTITINSGSLTQTLTVTTIDDLLPELDKKLIVSLNKPHNVSLSNESIGIGTITDNDVGDGISSIHTSRNSSCALGSNGDLKCWGLKARGGLGLISAHVGDDPGEMGDNLPEILLPTGRTAIDVAVNAFNTCILLDNNAIVCLGNDENKRTGSAGSRGWKLSDMGDNLEQMTFPSGTPQKLYAGDGHFCALMVGGDVRCWGRRSYGVLGTEDDVDKYILESDIVDLGTGRTAKDLALGYTNTCAILDNDLLKCWGDGRNGLNANGDNAAIGNDVGEMGDALLPLDFGVEDRVLKVAAARDHICALLFNNEVKCWGNDAGGTLGVETSEDIGDDVGELALVPSIDFGTGRTVKDISASFELTCAILDNDQVKCWGDDRLYYGENTNFGAFGDPFEIEYGEQEINTGDNWPTVDLGTGRSAKKIMAGMDYACALLDNDDYKCWGRNETGQLGQGIASRQIPSELDQMGDNLLPIDVGTGRNVDVIPDRAMSHQCVILDNAQVKCWGAGNKNLGASNAVGHLGNASNIIIGNEASDLGANLEVASLGSTRTVKNFFAGPSGDCAKLDNDEVRCFGGQISNTFAQNFDDNSIGDIKGQLGDNNPYLPQFGSERIIKIVHGHNNSCILFDDFTLNCVGANSSDFREGRPNISGREFERIYDEKIDLGTDRYVLDVDIDSRTVCVVLDNFQVKCFGSGSNGILGNADTSTIGDDPGELGDNNKYIDLGTGVEAIDVEVARGSACAILSDETLKCWGHSNAHGQGTSDDLGDDPGEMGDSLGVVYLGAAGTKVLQLVGADEGTRFCALTEQTGIKKARCWGRNNDAGVLALGFGNGNAYGDGATEMQSTISDLDFGTGLSPIQVELGGGHACALLDDGSTKCWGANTYGTLGIGNEEDIGDDPGEMGDALPAVNVSF